MYTNRKSVFIACLAGSIIALSVGVRLLQTALYIRTCICEYIKNGIEKSTACNFQTEVSACHLFPLIITCTSAYATPLGQFPADHIPHWYWHCKELTFKFSWLPLIFSHKLIATIEVEDLKVYSTITHETLAISDHLEKIFLGKFLSLPVTIKTLKIKNGVFNIDAPEYKAQAQTYFSGTSKKNNHEFKSIWHLNNGSFTYKNNRFVEFFTGTFRSHLINRAPKDISFKANAVIHAQKDQNRLVFVDALLESDGWQINARVPDFLNDQLHINAKTNSPAHVVGTAQLEKVPLQCEWKLQNSHLSIDLSNTHTIELQAINWLLKPTNIHSTLDRNGVSFSCAIPIENRDTGVVIEKKFSSKTSFKSLIFPIQQSCTYQELLMLAPAHWRNLFPGSGTIHFAGKIGWPKSSGTITFSNGAIVLGKSCNLCTGFCTKLSIDVNKKILTASDTHAVLYYGTLSCPEAQFNFDNQWQLIYAHIPILIKNCLINWNRNITLGSGLCVCTYTPNSSNIDARLTLEKTHLASTIVAQVQQPQTLAHLWTQLPFNINLRVETKKPLRIHIPGLKTKAHAILYIQGPLSQPDGTGVITLHGGTMMLSSHPFTIINGTIHINLQRIEQSLVELIAQTTIQQHNVTLHVLGTLKNPIIKLTSSPILTEQQIMALLVAGSPETSLNTALPALITQTLTQLFSANHVATKANRIKFVPHLTDPTGTTGIAGAIEIDFSDRFKAKVEKNLDLKENLAVEVDYALSDELDLKAFKDNKGQIGGHAQIKFKW